MTKTNLLCVIMCMITFTASIFLGGGTAIYYNTVAFLVVFPGIIGATFLSYPYEQIENAYYVAINAYTKKLKSPTEVINTLLDMGIKSKYDGILSLENYKKKNKLSFLDKSINLIVDNFSDEEIKEILTSEMHFFQLRRQQTERLFRHMANLAPAFGIAGSVIGLISMFGTMGATDNILKNIPIALVSTLYGIILSYFLFNPIAECINSRTQKELLLKRIIMSGVITIRSEANSYKLETKLSAFLTPSERRGVHRNVIRFRENFKNQRVANLRAN